MPLRLSIFFMDIILKLILAHFIADYPLQPGILVAWKKRSVWGILVHTLIHLLTMVILLWPYFYLDSVGWALSFIFIVHNMADFVKIRIDRIHKKGRLARYLLDQAVHFASVFIAWFLWLRGAEPRLSGAMEPYYSDLSWILFLMALVLSTYVYDVTRWTCRNAKKPGPYLRDWNGMARNAAVVTAVYLIYILQKL